MSTHATAHQSMQERFPFSCGSTGAGNCCLPDMGFLGILSQTCLVVQELFPTNVSRIGFELQHYPFFHWLAHYSCSTSPCFAQHRIDRTAPIDKGSCVGGVVHAFGNPGFAWLLP